MAKKVGDLWEFEDDNDAIQCLVDHDFTVERNGLIRSNGNEVSGQTLDAVLYLCREWDFDYTYERNWSQ